MDACTNPDILKVIYFFLLIVDIVKIIIPIALIILGIIDFSKSVITSDEKVQKKAVNLFFKRLLYAILVFAVPWIIEVLMVTLGDLLSEEVNFTDCIQNANAEKIAELEGEKPGKTKEEACYYCPTSNQYLWNSVKPESGLCPGGIGWTKKENVDENNCEIKNENGACYYCAVTDIYLWRPGVPSENCPGGIQWTKKTDITKNNCK